MLNSRVLFCELCDTVSLRELCDDSAWMKDTLKLGNPLVERIKTRTAVVSLAWLELF